MKKLLITSALATAIASGSVLANPAAQQGDLDQIFAAQGKAGQVAALSHQEMKETEGELFFAPILIGAAIGAGVNAFSYGLSVPRNQWTKTGFGVAVGTGAAGGALGPVGGVIRGGSLALGSASGISGATFGMTGSHIGNNWYNWGRRR